MDALLESGLKRSGLSFEEAVKRGLEASGMFKTEEEALLSSAFDSREEIAEFGVGCAILSALLPKNKRGLSASKAAV